MIKCSQKSISIYMAKDSYNEQDYQSLLFSIPVFDYKKPQYKSKQQKVEWRNHQLSNTKSLNTPNHTLTLSISIYLLFYYNCNIKKNSQTKHAMKDMLPGFGNLHDLDQFQTHIIDNGSKIHGIKKVLKVTHFMYLMVQTVNKIT